MSSLGKGGAAAGARRSRKSIAGDSSIKMIEGFKLSKSFKGQSIALDGTMQAGPTAMKKVLTAATRTLVMGPAEKIYSFDLKTEITDPEQFEKDCQYVFLARGEKLTAKKLHPDFKVMKRVAAEVDMDAVQKQYPQFSEGKLKELKTKFDEIDTDKSGSLDYSEIQALIKQADPDGAPPKKKEVLKAIKEIDENDSGTLEFDEFVGVYVSIRHNKDNKGNVINKAVRKSKFCIVM